MYFLRFAFCETIRGQEIPALSQLDYDALIAIKDTVINNSCSRVSVMNAFKVCINWVKRCEHFQLSSLGQSISESCDHLSDYCSTTEQNI